MRVIQRYRFPLSQTLLGLIELLRMSGEIISTFMENQMESRMGKKMPNGVMKG